MLEHLRSLGRARISRDEWRSTVFSVLLHVVVVALLIWQGDNLKPLLVGNGGGAGAGTGPTSGPAGGGGGGSTEEITYFDIVPAPAAPTPAAAPEEEPPVEEPPVEVPEPTPEPVAAPPVDIPVEPSIASPGPPAGEIVAGRGTGQGEGTGEGQGPGAEGGSGGGQGGGIGSGTGPGTGGGAGDNGIRPPTPVSVILPPTPPPSVRGRSVLLRLTVNTDGRVTRTAVVTSTGDRGFDNRLRDTATDWRFHPARDPSGRPVVAQVDISFSF